MAGGSTLATCLVLKCRETASRICRASVYPRHCYYCSGTADGLQDWQTAGRVSRESRVSPESLEKDQTLAQDSQCV